MSGRGQQSVVRGVGLSARVENCENVVDHMVLEAIRVNRYDVNLEPRPISERELHDLAPVLGDAFGVHNPRSCLTDRA